jgi:hypothetical protein
MTEMEAARQQFDGREKRADTARSPDGATL